MKVFVNIVHYQNLDIHLPRFPNLNDFYEEGQIIFP